MSVMSKSDKAQGLDKFTQVLQELQDFFTRGGHVHHLCTWHLLRIM